MWGAKADWLGNRKFKTRGSQNSKARVDDLQADSIGAGVRPRVWRVIRAIKAVAVKAAASEMISAHAREVTSAETADMSSAKTTDMASAKTSDVTATEATSVAS